jgi:hypothetical protein
MEWCTQSVYSGFMVEALIGWNGAPSRCILASWCKLRLDGLMHPVGVLWLHGASIDWMEWRTRAAGSGLLVEA